MEPLDRLKQFLTEKKLKQSDLSKKLKVTSAAISRIMLKQSKITPQFALSLQAVYNLNSEWLLNGTEPQYRPPDLSSLPETTLELIKLFQGLPQKPGKYRDEVLSSAKEQARKYQVFLEEQEEYERKHRESVKQMYDNRIIPQQMVPIPIVGTVKAGVPTYSEERVDDYHYYADQGGQVAKNPQNYYYMRVAGDSMSECRMWDGDIILVQKDAVARTGDIVVVRLKDSEDITTKKIRFLYDSKKVELIPCNPNYETMTYPGDQVVIEGVVINIDWSRKR